MHPVPDPPRPAWVAPDMEAVPFDVPLECAGWRIDHYLSRRIRWISRTRAQRIVTEGAVDRTGRRLRPSHRLAAGERFWVFRRPRPEPPPPDLPITVLHEDPHLLVLDKPAGWAAHPTSRYREATVTRFLERRYPGDVPRIGHRIDRETSGVTLATRSYPADRALKRLFERREVHKRYLAVVRGRPPADAGRIDLPLGPATGGRIHIKMEARPDGLPASTGYRLLCEAGPYALLQAEPLTGRQHQIRAHFAAAGCPLVGDKIYEADEELFLRWIAERSAGVEAGAEEIRARLVLDRHALHAWRIGFPHPVLGHPCRFTAPVPPDIADLLDRHTDHDWRRSLPDPEP